MDNLIYLLVPIVALATYGFGSVKWIGTIRSSSVMGIFVYLFVPEQALILYGATFVGMCSARDFSWQDIILSALFYYIIVCFMTGWFKGIGGTLGFSAFLGVVLWQIIKRVGKNLNKRLNVKT